jgi:lysophospholipase L1-like esterase
LAQRTMWSFVVDRMERKARVGEPKAFLLTDPEQARARARTHLDEGANVKVQLRMEGGLGCSWVTEPSPLVPPGEGQCVTTMVVNRGAPTTVEARDATGRIERATVEVKELVLVAMGDSFSSGEGNPDRPAIYPTNTQTPRTNDWFLHSIAPIAEPVWLDPICHRSMLSWPVLASLRVALENADSIVKLVNVTCSGAEFIDGLFLAQKKTVEKRYVSAMSSYRNGVGKRDRFPTRETDLFLPLSQVNAVRDNLCTWGDQSEDLSLGGLDYMAAWRTCLSQKLQPDALMLTAGGNDVEFGKAVMGVLIPDEGRTGFGQVGMDIVRHVAGAAPPAHLTKKALAMSANYADYVSAVSRGAMVPAEQAVLVKYPNPIGPKGINCHSANERIKASFMTFGPAVKTKFKGANWAVNLGKQEVTEFTSRSYPALMEMQDRAPNAFTRVAWLDSVTAADGTTAFDGRLLCTEEKEATQRTKQAEREPFFFCRGRECSPFEVKPLSAWNFELPGRRIVNTTNDVLLAQRTWGKSRPTDEALTVAMSGAFHPVTEAHAVAADSAYKGLCKVLKRRDVQCPGLR